MQMHVCDFYGFGAAWAVKVAQPPLHALAMTRLAAVEVFALTTVQSMHCRACPAVHPWWAHVWYVWYPNAKTG